MATRIGLSSGTLPSSSAGELAARTLQGNGDAVDLRAGKGHAWERAGLRRGIADITDRGVTVVFIGVSMVAGDPESAGFSYPGVPGYPIKAFCAGTPDVAVLAAQADAAVAADTELWVELHRGGPNAADLIRLAAEAGVGVVVDLLGLVETGGACQDTLRDLAPHVRAVQVKGVHTTPDRRHRHRPLRPVDLEPLHTLLAGGASPAAITVESKAGRPLDDLAVLRAELGDFVASAR
ncbi:hypothetical protein [Nocardia sp. NPDC052566]|uniref:hypothetical protein n=1 Tax=Nocardia sp. NPDC052566 TaxID=3364330 RepID=UPI0037C9DD57